MFNWNFVPNFCSVHIYRQQRSWGKVMFLHVCVILFTGGACVVAGGVCVVAGGHAWLPGAHVWLLGGHAWLLGVWRGCWGAACMVGGACMVAMGHAWLLGGMHGCQEGVHGCGGACMVAGGCHACVGYDEIRSMSGRYVSYWNAFLF